MKHFYRSIFLSNPVPLQQSPQLQIDKIDFSNTSPVLINNEFPTIFNTNNEPFFQFGDYTPEFLNKKVNNLAFFEATRNSVLSAGYTNGVPCSTGL
nr:hypothetical protein [Nonlabens ulvanivorans]